MTIHNNNNGVDVLSGHITYDTNSYEDKQPIPAQSTIPKQLWAHKRSSVDSKKSNAVKESGAFMARTIGPPPKKHSPETSPHNT